MICGIPDDVGAQHPHGIDQAKEHTQTDGKTNGMHYKHPNLIIIVKFESKTNQMYTVQGATTEQTNKEWSLERKMDILLIQEPPLALVRREWSFPSYRIYIASGPNPLTAIMVHVSLSSHLVDLEGDRVCGAVVTTQVGNLWVFSAYIRYLMGVGLDQLSCGLELAALASRLRFVGMDSNGHSPLWGPNTVQLDRVAPDG